MPSSKPPPALKAMLVCDVAVVDANTGKWSLLGIFSQITAHRLPCRHKSLCVYARLTEVRAEQELRLELRDLARDQLVGHGNVKVNAVDPLATTEIVCRLNNLVFPHPGKYEFQLLAGDELLGSTELVVGQAK